MEQWSNSACYGYAIMAMRDVGLDEETIEKVIRAMYYCFDEYTLQEAEKAYIEF